MEYIAKLFALFLFASLASATLPPPPPSCGCQAAPKKCGLNEVYSECGNHGCQDTCANPTRSWTCRPICTPGCICAEGYLRNSKGVCVLKKNCDCPGRNQVFSECDNHPCQNTCKDPDLITRCTYEARCYPGCICEKGYLRDENGVCVPQRQCYKCKENEIFKDAGSFSCQNTCDNPHISKVCGPGPLEPGCFCLDGFVRDDKGNCILESQCPKKCTGAHEVYSECGNNSCQKNCDTYDLNLACKPACFPGCICEDGYIRNKNGVCVKPEECENRQCTGKNEEYSKCVSPCGETCATMNKNITCNFLVCNPGCDCKIGFFRNSKNECVPPEECDCPANESLNLCYNPCPPRTCDSIGKMIKCPVPETCKPACDCAFNYRRNADGVCIPIESCPPLVCDRPNEVYNPCPDQCLDESCKSLYIITPCSRERSECRPKCVCKSGHLRNDKSECVPKEKCKEYCAAPNTIFDTCGNVCPITCENKDKQRVCPKICKLDGGCVCKKGFVENSKGICIPPEQCPKNVCPVKNTCPGQNEEYRNNCPIVQETCATMGIHVCKEFKAGCCCKDGYVRDCHGKCIKKCDCPKY